MGNINTRKEQTQMKKWKKSLAGLLSAAMLLGLLAACGSAEQPTDSAAPSAAPSAAATPAAGGGDYPLEPQELGSGEVKWSEEKTADGWMKVTNQGGETLGYSPDSGVKLIQVDGFAFKDLNRNGKLDLYEDWRQEDNARAEDLASQLPAESILPLMIHESVFNITEKIDEDGFKACLDEGKRTVLNFGTSFPAKTQAGWNNSIQAYAESKDYGIPVDISTNPRTMNIFPGNLALAATFNTDLAAEVSKELAREYRALGVITLLGPQIDLSTEPRWRRISGAYGEDPALSRDMTNATTSAYQSTYDESGKDLGWGPESVIGMIKHYPGDGAAEAGREAHSFYGKYNVYPGDSFATHLIAFFDGGLHLNSMTGEAAAVMPSYSIAWSDDESLGELVGSAASEFKLGLLRDNGYDGLICTDWGTCHDVGGNAMATPWGMEKDYTKPDRMYKELVAGIDQIGGEEDVAALTQAYQMLVDELGEDNALARIRESARRITRLSFLVGQFENPYVSVADAEKITGSAEAKELGTSAQQQSVVMLKNSDSTIQTATGGDKPTVYIPMQFSGGKWSLPVSQTAADAVYNVVTDTVGDPTGTPDKDGNATYTEQDIVRATAADLADCDYALVVVKNPQNGGGGQGGYDTTAEKYIPISLQYGDYVANSEGVRRESIAGDMVETQVQNEYGTVTVMAKENRSYYGESAVITNKSDLEGILYATENMPESARIIVAVNADRPMVFSEFEDKVDAILMGFGINNDIFLDIAAGKVEPSGLLPLQMPANMETVEAQLEDVPRDMECYVDSAGNTYDFGFGMNWSGVIQDERTAKYCVPPLTTPETVSIG